MNTKSQGHPVLAWLIFLIWPIGAVLYAFKQYKYKWGKNIIWAFVTFYGYIFTIPPNSSIDANRYRDYLELLNHTHASLGRVVENLYNPSTSFGRVNYDIFQPLLTWVVAQFTDDYHVLFLFVGLVFGYFFSRCLWIVLERLKGDLRIGVGIVVLLLFFIIAPWRINWVRYYTAALIFIYGILLYYWKGRKRGAWIAITSILFHYSFIFPVLLWGVKIIFIKKNNFKLLFWVFIITIPTSILSMTVFADLATSVLPNVFQQKIDAYTSDYRIDLVQQSQMERSLFTVVYDYFRPALMLIMGIVMYRKQVKIKHFLSQKEYSFLCFMMLFAIAMNLLGFVPTLERFFYVVFFLMTSIFLICYQEYSLKINNRGMLIIAPLCILYAIGAIRYGIGYGLTGIEYIYKSPGYLLINMFI